MTKAACAGRHSWEALDDGARGIDRADVNAGEVIPKSASGKYYRGSGVRCKQATDPETADHRPQGAGFSCARRLCVLRCPMGVTALALDQCSHK